MEFHLSNEQKIKFEEQGLLVIPEFFDPKPLFAEAKALLDDFTLEGHPLTQFTTKDSHVGDEYFLESGDKIRFFFEPDAFVDGKLTREKELAINKIGHGLHIGNKTFSDFTLANENIKNLAKELKYHQHPLVIQSMIICKQPEIGGAVHSHDDSTFLYTEPLSALGFWFALQDCTQCNGCLAYIPGSHKVNKINKRLVRVDGGAKGTKIVSIAKEGDAPNPDWDNSEQEWVTVECKAGDLVLIHGSVIHRSEKNLSKNSRFIYTFHMIERDANYDDINWLQTPNKPFTSLLA